MEAHISLHCTLRAGSEPALMHGTTELVSRKVITLCLPGPPGLPGGPLTIWLDLPADAGRTPRALRCIATLRTLQRHTDGWRTVLDVARINFVERAGASL